jgi:hypothetical protein
MTFELEILSLPDRSFQASVDVCGPQLATNGQMITYDAGQMIYLGSGTTIEAAIEAVWASLAAAGIVLPEALSITHLQFSSP